MESGPRWNSNVTIRYYDVWTGNYDAHSNSSTAPDAATAVFFTATTTTSITAEASFTAAAAAASSTARRSNDASARPDTYASWQSASYSLPLPLTGSRSGTPRHYICASHW